MYPRRVGRHPFLRLVLTILIAAITPAARAFGQVQAPAGTGVEWRSLVGCYRAGDRHFAFDSVPYLAVHSHAEGSRLARAAEPSWQRGYDTYWRITAPDSVKLVSDAGLYGESFHFAVRGDSLVGLQRGYTDIVGVRSRPRKVVAVRESCPPDASLFPARPDSAPAALLFGYAAALPTDAQLNADPWRAVAPLRAWLAAHPEVRSDFYFRIHARTMFERAASIDVRATAHEFVGTYRLEIERTGGAMQVFYGRTEIRPEHALRSHDTSAVALDQPLGYRLRFTLAGDPSALPRPGPGRRHRRAYGDNAAANSHIDVRLPATVSADGTRRFRAYVMLVNFADYFRKRDRAISQWDYEWYRQHHSSDGPNVFAEFTVSPDGRVTFTQRQELGPDQVITLRGERISGEAWQCEREGC